MLECMIAETRKCCSDDIEPAAAGHLSALFKRAAVCEYACIKGRKESKEKRDAYCGKTSSPEQSPPRWRAPAIELQGAGCRRDRSAQFARMRRAARSSTCVPTKTATAASPEISAEELLCQLYSCSARDMASTASRLAQHNGLRQFGATFSSRAPPLELRMLLPELEASIEELLNSLQENVNRIENLSEVASSGRRLAEVQTAVVQYIRSYHEEASCTFDEQRQNLRKLQASSPFTSPMSIPVMPKKAEWSPGMQSLSSTLSTAVSTGRSPLVPMLDVMLAEDSSEDESEQLDRLPFSAVMSLELNVVEGS